jgi:hypothetical protein
VNRRFTLLLAAVTVTVGYAVFDFYDQKKSDEKKNQQDQIVKLNKSEVNELGIIRPAGTISVQKIDNQWKIVAPVQESADSQSVDDYLAAAVLEKSTAVAKEGPNIDFKVYQLDPPKAQLIFKSADKKVVVNVGGLKNFEGDSYIRFNNDDKVLVASSVWFARANKSLFDFQDKRLLKNNASEIEQLTVKRPDETIIVSKKNDRWIYPDKPDWQLDQNKVRDLISGLNSIQAYDLQKMNPSLKPKMSVEAKLKDKVWKSVWAVDAVQTPESNLWYRINQNDFDKYFKLKKEALRDRSLPFLFKKDEVAKMSFQTPLKKFALDKPDEHFLAKLQKLETFEFDGKKQALPLEKKEIQLLSKDGEVIFDLQMAGPEKKKFDGLDRNVYLAKTNLFDEYIYIDATAVDNLNIESLAPAKESAK